jgi:catechol 2,3-dioxygenase
MTGNLTPETKVLDSTTIIAPQLHHVNLKTRQVQAIIDWYALVVGMRPNFQFEDGAFLSNDDANHRLALLSHPDLKDDDEKVTRTGMHHLAFEYDDLDGLLGTYVRLKGHGIVPHIALDHGLTTSFYYLDPDGNSVELQADNFGDWTKSTEFIRNDERFRANPIGAPVDPDELVALREQGESADAIHTRAYAGEFPPTGPVDPRMPL